MDQKIKECTFSLLSLARNQSAAVSLAENVIHVSLLNWQEDNNRASAQAGQMMPGLNTNNPAQTRHNPQLGDNQRVSAMNIYN